MLYTPQQVQGFHSYSIPCRVGNWAEDEYNAALHTKRHHSQREAGQLTSAKLDSTIGVARAPVTLASPHADGFLRFGDVVMLSSGLGGALAHNVQEPMPLTHTAFQVSRTQPLAEPVGRACWRIVPTKTTPPNATLLTHGADFCLEAAHVVGHEAIYLQGMRYTAHNLGYSASVRGGERKMAAVGALEPSRETVWQVQSLDPRAVAQIESEGQPVAANAFVALRHANTQARRGGAGQPRPLLLTTGDLPWQVHLSSDEKKLVNHYGKEFEANLFTDTEVAKSEWGVRDSKGLGAHNHWAFTTGPAAEPAAEPEAEA